MNHWKSVLPEGVNLKEFERGDVTKLGGTPPIRVVPDLAAKEKSAPTFTQKLSDNVKETFQKFAGGTVEDACRHVIQYWSLVGRLRLLTQYNEAKNLREQYSQSARNLAAGPQNEETRNQQATAETAAAAQKTIMDEKRDQLYQLFERSLDADLIVHWSDTVVRVTSSED